MYSSVIYALTCQIGNGACSNFTPHSIMNRMANAKGAMQMHHALMSFFINYGERLNRLYFIFRCFLLDGHDGFIVGFAIKHLHCKSDHFCKIFIFTLVLILVCLQTSFDENEAAFLQVLLTDLAQATPSFDVHPLRIFLRFAFLALPAIADGYGKMSDLFSCWCKFAFRILPQTADQLNSI